jgi:hypothetical protein
MEHLLLEKHVVKFMVLLYVVLVIKVLVGRLKDVLNIHVQKAHLGKRLVLLDGLVVMSRHHPIISVVNPVVLMDLILAKMMHKVNSHPKMPRVGVCNYLFKKYIPCK